MERWASPRRRDDERLARSRGRHPEGPPYRFGMGGPQEQNPGQRQMVVRRPRVSIRGDGTLFHVQLPPRSLGGTEEIRRGATYLPGGQSDPHRFPRPRSPGRPPRGHGPVNRGGGGFRPARPSAAPSGRALDSHPPRGGDDRDAGIRRGGRDLMEEFPRPSTTTSTVEDILQAVRSKAAYETLFPEDGRKKARAVLGGADGVPSFDWPTVSDHSLIRAVEDLTVSMGGGKGRKEGVDIAPRAAELEERPGWFSRRRR